MAAEIANIVHALAVLNLNNPPSVIRGSGIPVTGGVTRLGVGVYEVAADPPLDITEGMGVATPIEGTGQVSVSVRDHSTFGPGNILVSTFSAAGAPADNGATALVLYRFPQVN
jgi:hypothetical protein